MDVEKPWLRGHNYNDRKINTRELKQTFLIVCEGSKTEPLYFESFKLTSATIKCEGTGMNTNSLVRETVRLMSAKKYDQVWCVFDRDSFPPENFNLAFSIAKENGIHIAYSNEAFELWYLLHFDEISTAFNRESYEKLLSARLKDKYSKSDEGMYEKLLDKQYLAIQRAEKLLEKYNPLNPEKNNPSTTVHLLVQQLNLYL